jgi:predicted glycosyltransferase
MVALNGGALCDKAPAQEESPPLEPNACTTAAAPRRQSLRVALYSHDTMGIGHIRRNQAIAQALMASAQEASSLLIAGAKEAGALVMPPGIDCLTLPAVSKGEASGLYGTRRLQIPFEELIQLRSQTIQAALTAYEPDVFIVDKAPCGVCRELEPALVQLRRGGRTRCILGLREILDEPAVASREWRQSESDEAVARFYDAVWVYGDRRLFDPIQEYGLAPATAAKVQFTGYFDRRQRLSACSVAGGDPLAELRLPPGRLALCMVGGGQDGALLARAFSEAPLPDDMNAVLITGPFMPREVGCELHRLAADRRRFRVIDFIAEPNLLLARAERVVAMGGYNTVSELLSFETPALLVPRVAPRQEQWIRAQRLRALGLVDVLHPDEVSAAAVARWLSDPAPTPKSPRYQLDFGGLSRLPQLLDDLLPSAPVGKRLQPFSLAND